MKKITNENVVRSLLFDIADTAFTSLRLWRDFNQDGISQTGELFTLSSQNIISINVANTEHLLTLTDGNQLADLGSYTKTDCSSGSMGEVSGNLADVNLASDTFHSQFADSIPLTTLAQTLPDMQGAGQLRSLREAANDKMNCNKVARENELGYGEWREAA